MLKQYGNCMVRYWTGEPVRAKEENEKCRRYRVQLTKRVIARARGERYVPIEHLVCRGTRVRPRLCTPDIVGSYTYFYMTQRVVGIAEDAESKSLQYTIKIMDLGIPGGVDKCCRRGVRSQVMACAPENQKCQKLTNHHWSRSAAGKWVVWVCV